MSVIISIEDEQCLDHRIVGSKAASLSKLYKAGFNVPRGFSLTVHACQFFYDLFKDKSVNALELGASEFILKADGNFSITAGRDGGCQKAKNLV